MDQFLPEVADNAASFGHGSDSYPYTIVSEEPRNIWVQQDIATPDVANGFDYFSNPVYLYQRNLKAPLEHFTLRKNGRWVPQGQPQNSSALSIGRRRYYQDPSF